MYKDALCTEQKRLSIENATPYYPIGSFVPRQQPSCTPPPQQQHQQASSTNTTPGTVTNYATGSLLDSPAFGAMPSNNSFDDTATPSHNDTHSVVTSRFDDMDSWVDDDECFYQSLREDLMLAQQQAAQSQASQGQGWKKVEGSTNTSGFKDNAGTNKKAQQAGKGQSRRGGRGAKSGTRQSGGSKDAKKDNTAFPPAPGGGRFDCLVPQTAKRFK